jgi:hypothetical protein
VSNSFSFGLTPAMNGPAALQAEATRQSRGFTRSGHAGPGRGRIHADEVTRMDTRYEDDERFELWLGAPGTSGPIAQAGRALLLGLLALWTAWFLHDGVSAESLGGSFLHLVNLPFHEAGHVLFSPFGRFMMTLGGSLLQVAVPAICAVVFLTKTRDPFAASAALWWAGQSLMDLAPYIADARALQLVLLGGHTGAEVEGHDWEYLLETLGWLHRDIALGHAAFVGGAVVMIAGLAWGAAVLVRQYRSQSPA